MSGMTTWVNAMRPESRRYILFSGLAFILILAGVGVYFALKPSYQVLFRDLKPRDARVVVAALDQDKIAYSFDEETGSVLVPSGDARSMRLKLLEGGLHLQGVVGLELFDQSDLGLTDFAQKVNYQRALQGELARTIMTLDDVDMARVHLTLPESSLFRRDQARPRASVAIFMRGDRTLTADVVRGIQQLIAASVSDLTPSDVVIVDQRGLLSGGSASAVGSEQAWAEQQLRDLYERKTLQALSNLRIPSTSLTVDVIVDFDEVAPMDKDSVAQVVAHGLPREKHRDKEPLLFKEHANSRVETDGSEDLTMRMAGTLGVIQHISVKVELQHPLSEPEQQTAAMASAIGINSKRGDELIFSVPQSPSNDYATSTSAIPGTTVSPEQADAHIRRIVHAPPDTLQQAKWWLVGLIVAGLLLVSGAMIRKRRRAVSTMSEESRRVLAARLQRLLAQEGSVHVAEK